MPAAIGIAGAAVGSIVSSKIQSNAAKRAAEAQERASNQALEYQKSRDTRADSIYDKKWALYQEAVNDWRKRNGGGSGPAIPNLVQGGGGGGGVPISLADLVGDQQRIAQAQGGDTQDGSIADAVNGGFDWRRYGA